MSDKPDEKSPTPTSSPSSPSPTRLGPLTLVLILAASLATACASLLWLSAPSPLSEAMPTTPSFSPTSLSTARRTLGRTLRLGSFNIRMDGSAAHPLLYPFKEATDSLAATLLKRGGQDSRDRWGEKRWYERREKLVDQVLFSELDVVGFQEVLDNQFQDLTVLLGEEWEHVGVGAFFFSSRSLL